MVTKNEARCPHTRRTRHTYKTDNVMDLVDKCASPSCGVWVATYRVWTRLGGYDTHILNMATDALRADTVIYVGGIDVLPEEPEIQVDGYPINPHSHSQGYVDLIAPDRGEASIRQEWTDGGYDIIDPEPVSVAAMARLRSRLDEQSRLIEQLRQDIRLLDERFALLGKALSAGVH